MNSLQRHIHHAQPDEIQKLRNGIYTEKIKQYSLDEIEKELEVLKQQIEEAGNLNG